MPSPGACQNGAMNWPDVWFPRLLPASMPRWLGEGCTSVMGDPAGGSKGGDAAARTRALYAEWAAMPPTLWEHPIPTETAFPRITPAPARSAGLARCVARLFAGCGHVPGLPGTSASLR